MMKKRAVRPKPEWVKESEARSSIVQKLPRACSDEDAAIEFLEEQRWGGFPQCDCGSRDVYEMVNRQTQKRGPRYLWRCRECNRQFTVRAGTVFEDSRIPLRHWCYAFWAACASKKGVSAKQIQRMTGLSYKSALFLMHRIRFAMTEHQPRKLEGVIEADEGFVGGKPRYRTKGGQGPRYSNKTAVLVALERDGEVRAEVSKHVTSKTVGDFLKENVKPGQVLMSDESRVYLPVGRPHFREHHSVNHSALEYARGPASSNTAESFLSLFKRGLYGTFHSVSKKHLHRYAGEFGFRWNHRKDNDGERTQAAIRNAVGKRLLYREPVQS